MKVWVISDGIGYKPRLAKTKEKALEILNELGNHFKDLCLLRKYRGHEIKDFEGGIKLVVRYNRGNPKIYEAYPIEVAE